MVIKQIVRGIITYIPPLDNLLKRGHPVPIRLVTVILYG